MFFCARHFARQTLQLVCQHLNVSSTTVDCGHHQMVQSWLAHSVLVMHEIIIVMHKCVLRSKNKL